MQATLNPSAEWDGNPNFEFKIRGTLDSNCTVDKTHRSTSGWAMFLNNVPVTSKSKLQVMVLLLVTESELNAASSCVQDMMHVMRVIKSMGLKVEKPMLSEVDDKGVADLCNNWSVGGCTRHVNCHLNFLRELKEYS